MERSAEGDVFFILTTFLGRDEPPADGVISSNVKMVRFAWFGEILVFHETDDAR